MFVVVVVGGGVCVEGEWVGRGVSGVVGSWRKRGLIYFVAFS
jgi:hypothetical protein